MGSSARPIPADTLDDLDKLEQQYGVQKPTATASGNPGATGTLEAGDELDQLEAQYGELNPAGPYAGQVASFITGQMKAPPTGAPAAPQPAVPARLAVRPDAAAVHIPGTPSAEPPGMSVAQAAGLSDTSVPGRVANVAGQMAGHPLETATAMATYFPKAYWTLIKFADQENKRTLAAENGEDPSKVPTTISKKDAAIAAVQIATVGLGALDAPAARIASPFLGEIAKVSPEAASLAGRWAAIGYRGAQGAVAGATAMPQDPLVGGIIGGGLGAAGAGIAGERMTPRRIPVPERTRIADRGVYVPQGTARVAPEGVPPAATEPDFTVEPIAAEPTAAAGQAGLPPELEHLAQFTVKVSTPGMDDIGDLAMATAQIKALPKEQQAAVRARIKDLRSAPPEPKAAEPAPSSEPTPPAAPSAPTGPLATIKQAVQNAPKQQPVVQPRSVPIAPNAAGHENVVALSDGRELPVRYAVVPAASLVASHHPETFAVNPEYPEGVQGRAYHGARGKAAREHVIQETQRLNPTKLLDLGSSVSGPPVITPDGYAIIGNQRTMMLQRAASMLPDRYAEYRDKLAQVAPRLGIDPTVLANTRAPVLVRVMDPNAVNTRDVATLAELNRVSDIADVKAKGAASEGASRAAALVQAPQVLDQLRESMSPQETIGEFLNGADGEKFVRELVRSGVIGQQEAGRFLAPRGGVTPDGKEIVKNMLYAAAVPDPDVLDRAPRNIKLKIEHAIPAIVQANLMPGYELGQSLTEALDLLYSARANSQPLSTYLGEGDLTGTVERDPSAVALAVMLDMSNKAHVAEAFRKYATIAREAMASENANDMFGYTPPSREQLIQTVTRVKPDAFGGESLGGESLGEAQPGYVERPGQQGNLSFRITPELKAKVEAEGQPLMEKTADYSAQYPAAPALSPKEARRMAAGEATAAQGSVLKATKLAESLEPYIREVEERAFAAGAETPDERRAFVEQHRAGASLTIVGADVSTPEKLRAALTVMRHPLTEHASFLFEKDGHVADHFIYESGSGVVIQLDALRVAAEVARRAKELGARVIMAHNHPSGEIEPSPFDRRSTSLIGAMLAKRGVQLIGHMLIDHDKGTWFTPKGNGEFDYHHVEIPGMDQHPWLPAAERDITPSTRFNIGRLVRQISHPKVLTVLYRDAGGRIIVAEPRDPSIAPEELLQAIDAQRVRLQAYDIVLAAPHTAAPAFIRAVKAARAAGMTQGHYVTDVVAIRQHRNNIPDTASAVAYGALDGPDFDARHRLDLANSRLATRVEPTGNAPVPAAGGGAESGSDLRPGPGVRGGEGQLGELTGGFGTDLFGNPEEPSPSDQESLFGNTEGTTKSRSLAETEADARAKIARIEQELSLLDGKGRYGMRASERELARQEKRRRELAAELVPLKKLVNRGQAISHDELRTRIQGGDDFFGERQPDYGFDENGVLMEPGAGYGTPEGDGPIGSAADFHGFTTEHEHPTPEASGLSQHRGRFRPLEILPAVKHLIAPEALDHYAKGTAGNLGEQLARSFRELTIAQEALKSFGREVGKLTKQEAVAYWDAAEHGESTGNATFDAGNRLLHQITEQYTKQLIALDRLKASAAIQHYIGRFWTAPNRQHVVDFLRSIFKKRPIEGPKSFLKHRALENFTDGLDAGLVPATYNYVDSQLAKIAEMQRVLTFERVLRAEQQAGRARPVMIDQQPPRDDEGHQWVRIGDGTDPAFIIYGNPNVTHWEAVDELVFQKLQNVIRSLKVEHVRSTSIGGPALGYAEGDKRIRTRFGGTEGTIMHELGHILDVRFGLGQRIEDEIGKPPKRTAKKGKRARQQVPDYSKKGGDTKEARERRKQLKEEWRNLANLRRETMGGVPSSQDLEKGDKAYLHSRPEKMANVVEAFIHTPERFKQVAPGIWEIFNKIVDENPALHPLRDIKPTLAREPHTTETNIGGLVVKGHWYAPRGSAAVWNNHLSRGLKGNPIIDAYLAPAQMAGQILLSFSGFHATVIATEGVFSELALAIDNIANAGGNPLTAIRQVPHALTSPVTTARLGRKIMEEYRRPGMHPELAAVLDLMIKGGYRARFESELWTGERREKFMKALRDAMHGETALRKAWGAARVVPNAFYAAVEGATLPILGRYVPYMKAGAAYMAVAQAMKRLPPGASVDDVHRLMRDIVHEMDYRFGQVEYDNHFLNNAVKHIAQMLFLAPGWTFGTLELARRGVRDVATIPAKGVRANLPAKERAEGEPEPIPEELIGRSAAYWMAAVLGTMLVSGIMTYYMTGDEPHDEDWFAFRDGNRDTFGNPNRHVIPGYLMHDIYSWGHHPVQTFTNKLNPLLGYLGRLAHNRTYFGDEIYDPEAPLGQQAKEIAGQAKDEFLPLSWQNYEEAVRRGEGDPAEFARNFFGVTPAKRELVRTPAENLLFELSAREGDKALTPEERQAADARRAIRDSIARGQAPRSRIGQLRRAGELTPGQATAMRRQLHESLLRSMFQSLSAADKLKVWALANDAERKVWHRDALRAYREVHRQDQLKARTAP